MNKKKKMMLFLFLFLSLFLISYFFPYVNDDWVWGSERGIIRFKEHFAGFNGRYLGNLLVLLLTRSRILKAFIISAIFTLISYILDLIFNSSNNAIITYIIMLINLLLPISLFQEVFSWTSGFCNYVPPMLLMLIYFFSIKKDKKSLLFRFPPFALILGISISLFIEHITVFCVALAVIKVFFALRKKVKLKKWEPLYFSGNVLGSIIMFSNSAYFNILKGNDFYRSVPKENFIAEIISKYFSIIYSSLISNNILILLIIGVCFSVLYRHKVYNNRHQKKAVYYSLFFTIYSLVSLLIDKNSEYDVLIIYIDGILCFLYIVSFIYLTFTLPKSFKSKKRLICIIISIFVLLIPLLFVEPISPRCFYPMYILELMFSLILLKECSVFINIKKIKIIGYYVCKFLLFSVLINYFFISLTIFQASKILYKSIETQKTQKCTNMVFPKLPYEKYMRYSSPDSETENAVFYFKKYYKIDNNANIHFVDYDNWDDNLYKETCKNQK